MMGKETRNGKLDQRPSDVFREHFVIAPYPEENISRILDVLSPDCLVFGSDFPHPEGLPDPVTYVNQLHDSLRRGSAEDHEHQPRRVSSGLAA